MSQNESTTFLVTDAKNLTLIDATRENSPWCYLKLLVLFQTFLLTHRLTGAISRGACAPKNRAL